MERVLPENIVDDFAKRFPTEEGIVNDDIADLIDSPALASDFPVKLGPGAQRVGEKHIAELDTIISEGRFDDALAYLEQYGDEILPEDYASMERYIGSKQQGLEEILEKASFQVRTTLDPKKNAHLKTTTREIVRQLRPSHVTDSDSARQILENGRILSLKRQNIPNRYYEERGLEDKVFFNFGGSNEKLGRKGPVFVAHGDILDYADFEATPLDSFLYGDFVEIQASTITDPVLLKEYYRVYLQNEGRIVPTKTFVKRSSTFPEVRFESEVNLEDIEVILVSPEDFEEFMANPLISESVKRKLINVETLGASDPIEGYYYYVGLKGRVNVPLESAS